MGSLEICKTNKNGGVMEINKEDIEKSANIAKIYLTQDEISKYMVDLKNMTEEFLDTLEELNISLDMNFDFNTTSLKYTNLRQDIPDNFNNIETIYKNAPKIKNNLFVVPEILKENKK